MAGQLQSEFSKSRMRSCRCSRALSIQHCTGWSSRGGSALNGPKPTAAARPSFTPCLPPAEPSWNGKKKAGAGYRVRSISWSRARSQRRRSPMRWLEQFRMATLMLFRRQQQTVRLDAELQFHLDQQVKENLARGLSPEEAHYAALRTFGNPALLRDQARSSWSWNWLEKLLRDLRYGVRTLTRSPGFALTAILVMALGIGATTSLFTIVRAVLL